MQPEAKEHCGVIGIYGASNAATKIYYGLYALQHRGQESAGIVVSDGQTITSRKGLGLLPEVFSERDLRELPGHFGVGHVRYSTTGSGRVQNIQPLIIEYAGGLVAVGHNGNLVNARALRKQFGASGSIFQTSTDSELIVHLMASPEHSSLDDPIAHSLGHLRGAYSIVIMTKEKLIAARDPQGFRPLCLGQFGGAYVIASETCAFDLLRAEPIREIEPGEMIVISASGLESKRFCATEEVRPAHCIFEHVYFARPDSVIFGENVHNFRVRLGRRLALDQPADADLVIPVPDSGNSAALGFSQASDIPLDHGFIRNHYIGRTFIMPIQDARQDGVEIKLNVLRDVVRGKRLVVVDDSIIRGTTAKGRLLALRQAGAREIHVRISCPPTRFPCYYGIDFPSPKELIAANRPVSEIREFLGVESLGYQSLDGMLACASRPRDHYCTACYTGCYPVTPEEDMDKLALEQAY